MIIITKYLFYVGHFGSGDYILFVTVLLHPGNRCVTVLTLTLHLFVQFQDYTEHFIPLLVLCGIVVLFHP